MNNTRICAACGKEKPASEFGDGIKWPRTTCFDCVARNKLAVQREKDEDNEQLKDMVYEYVKELRLQGDKNVPI